MLPLTIKETKKALLAVETTVEKLVQSYLTNIKEHDKKINAFLTVAEKEALARAKKMDAVLKEEGGRVYEKYPLLGVVVAYKDNYLTKGIKTTAASKVLEDYIPQYSATVVERLENAGAIGIGKTNLDAWAHGSSGENSDFGDTKNPWNTNYVPGGSSSGSGAALAANFSLISTGSDTCGSIRLPANYCGVYGLKPTYGSVSRYGIVAMGSSLDSIGHFGRTADDIEAVFEVTKGTDGYDGTLKDESHPTPKGPLTIGVPKEFFVDGLDKDIKSMLDKTLATYEDNGVKLVEVSLPHTKYGISVYYIIQPAEVSSNLGRYDGIRYGNDRKTFGDEAKRRIMLGSYVLSSGYYDAYYLRAMKVRTLIRQEVEAAFKKVDALIAPVAPTPPFALGEKADDPLQMYLTDIYAATANLTGIPGLAVPAGLSDKGLPLGFQLMAPRFHESTLFDLARLHEEATSYSPQVATL